MMKKLKINLALLGLVLGVSAAYATSAPARPVATLYGLQPNGIWVQPRAQSHCTTNPARDCEAQFNGDPNNGGTEVPGTEVKGNFIF